MRSNLGRVLGYGLSVGLTAIVTLLSIPVVIGHSGAIPWASLALGQAIGTGFAVAVGFGWGTTGPTAIAMARAAERGTIYASSLKARLFLAVPGVTLAVVLASLLASEYKLESALTAAAFTCTGLLAGWYFTGSGQPYGFLLLDSLPRVVGTILGTLALLFGASLFVFPTLQLIGIVTGVVLSSRRICRGVGIYRWFRSGPTILSLLRGQSHGVAIAGVSAVYISLPMAIVAVAAPTALPIYALADKVLRFATTAFAPVVQFLQGWVPGPDSRTVRRRIKTAFIAGLVATTIAGTVFAYCLPWFAGILSDGEIVPSASVSVAFALVLVFLVMAQVVGLVCLLALQRARNLAIFTTIGAIAAIPAVLVGSILFGAQGAAWALVFGEAVALVPQILLLWRLLRKS